MNETVRSVSALLHEAGETHHQVFRMVDGADDDWASWYADGLVNLSELPQLLGTPPVRSELVYRRVHLDQRYIETQPSEPWEDHHRLALVEHFAAEPGLPARRRLLTTEGARASLGAPPDRTAR